MSTSELDYWIVLFFALEPCRFTMLEYSPFLNLETDSDGPV